MEALSSSETSVLTTSQKAPFFLLPIFHSDDSAVSAVENFCFIFPHSGCYTNIYKYDPKRNIDQGELP
jgi:hypothetical protein